MLTEKRFQKMVEKISKNIQVDIDIIDALGVVMASNERTRLHITDNFVLQQEWEQGKGVYIHEGKTYFRFEVDRNQHYFVALNGASRVIRNYCYLVSNLLEVYFKSLVHKLSQEEIFRRMLLGQLNELELHGYAKDYKMELVKERCVFVMQTIHMDAEVMQDILTKAFPKEEGDMLVVIDTRTLALIKTLDEDTESDDLIQMATAIDDTIQSEISTKAFIGIGGTKQDINGLRESYIEAEEAIHIGKLYNPNNQIFLFNRLLLERFLFHVPLEICRKFYDMIFQDDYNKLLTEEIVLTIQKFFENSLNLSETARQLYIHRNTLVYRLDKIQKVTGLDLRNFDDAVTFKIMMMIGRHISSGK